MSTDTFNIISGTLDAQPENSEITAVDIDELFPVVQLPEVDLQKYEKFPLEGLGILGVAFSHIPATARTIVQTTLQEMKTNEPYYVGINPKNVEGYLQKSKTVAGGITGNIMRVNDQGKHVVAGQMVFKEAGDIPILKTDTVTMPIDPTIIVIAVAVMAIEQRLVKIQASIEEVLKFLEMKEATKQRGNLKMLAEIAAEYKAIGNDRKFCESRTITVQNIQKEALQSLELYQEKIESALNKKSAVHLAKDTETMLNDVVYAFAEYQLGSYIYSYCTFLDVLLRKNFESVSIGMAISKMAKMEERYNSLFSKCHSQIARSQRSTLESKLIGGVGIAAKKAGQVIASIPIIEKGPVDEALYSAGKSLGKVNYKAVANKLMVIDQFEDSRMMTFIESLRKISVMNNVQNAMLTDGSNLYVLKTA